MNAALKADNTAITGEFIPANKPKLIGVDMANGPSVSVMHKPFDQQKGAVYWVDHMQNMLRNGRQRTLAGILGSQEPHISKALFVAAQLTRDDLNTPIDQLTGKQRHKLWLGIKQLNQLIQQLQKAGLYCVSAFNIGQNQPLQPATDHELTQIQQQKALRQQLINERVQQQEKEQQLKQANG